MKSVRAGLSRPQLLRAKVATARKRSEIISSKFRLNLRYLSSQTMFSILRGRPQTISSHFLTMGTLKK